MPPPTQILYADADVAIALAARKNAACCCVLSLMVCLKVPMASVSGLAITSLQVFNEKYRPYKGVRTLTKSGKNFQVRTG